jgi:hypothetical protein
VTFKCRVSIAVHTLVAVHTLGVVTARVDGLVSEMAYFIRQNEVFCHTTVLFFASFFLLASRVRHALCFASVRAFSESGPSEWAPAVQFITPPKSHRKV